MNNINCEIHQIKDLNKKACWVVISQYALNEMKNNSFKKRKSDVKYLKQII